MTKKMFKKKHFDDDSFHCVSSVGVHNSGPITRQLFDKICLVEECNDVVTTEMVGSGLIVDLSLIHTCYITPDNTDSNRSIFHTRYIQVQISQEPCRWDVRKYLYFILTKDGHTMSGANHLM